MRNFTTCFILLIALCTFGCGSKNEPGAAGTGAKTAAVKKVASPADSLSPNLVGGVVTGKVGATLLRVRFELAGRPVVGEPVDVDMVVMPQADNIDQFSGTVQGEDGLDVLSGAAVDSTEKPAFGVPIHHALKLIARRDGIFTLSAAMSVTSGGQSLSPVYSFPVIAGNGLADAAASAAADHGAGKPSGTAAAH